MTELQRVASPLSDDSGGKTSAVGSPVDVQVAHMTRYHNYLQTNYKHGVDRFFCPTGFLKKFERKVKVAAEKKRDAVFVRDMDDAASRLQKVVDGGEGVFDLVAEPGSGKTSVLPFRFPDSRVVVAMPTPFDAWAAFNMASGEASLRLKGLSLGRPGARVVYMDSYLAANMVLSGFMEYDVLVVDECDSGKGVTGFLADVKAPGKVLVRMSASHGRSSVAKSDSFIVNEQPVMPDVREGIDAVVDFVTVNRRGRSLVLAPDASTAAKLAELLPGSKLVSSAINLGELTRFILESTEDGLFISDDVCARGLNLNLNQLFDCQLVSEHGIIRHVTASELHQRKGRIGRNKSGVYYSPGLKPGDDMISDADVVRSNVVRAVVDVPQVGPARTHVTTSLAEGLLESAVEPYVEVMAEAQRDAVVAASVTPLPVSPPRVGSRSASAESKRSVAVTSGSSSGEDKVRELPLPVWMRWGMRATGKNYVKDTVRVVKSPDRKYSIERRRSSSSDSDGPGGCKDVALRDMALPVARTGPLSPRRAGHGYHAEGMPYAVSPPVRSHRTVTTYQPPVAPPVMDLSVATYEFEWPALLSDLVERCGDLPTIVPPGSWQHTSLGGMASDWLARLDGIAVGAHNFSSDEFEVVCRAWNLMVASTWVRKTPGLSPLVHNHKMEFCLRYFQMYYQLAYAG